MNFQLESRKVVQSAAAVSRKDPAVMNELGPEKAIKSHRHRANNNHLIRDKSSVVEPSRTQLVEQH